MKRKKLQIQFDVRNTPPESYVGFVDERGNAIGDKDLWAGDEVLSPEWDSTIADVYKLDLQRSYVAFPILERRLTTAYTRARAEATKEKRINKDPRTGQRGWWATSKTGKRYFVSADKMGSQRDAAAKDIALGALKAVGLGLTLALGAHGTSVALRSASLARGPNGLPQFAKGVKSVWKNRKAVADQLTFPFTSLKRAGLTMVPYSITPVGEHSIFFDYVALKGVKSLGNIGYSVNMVDRYLSPSVHLTPIAKGKNPVQLRKVFEDMYTRAQKLHMKEIRLRATADGGYAWARCGFDFIDPLQRTNTIVRAKRWLLNNSSRFTPGQIAEIESQIAQAKTARDFANMTYDHPQYGKIRLGKEFMQDADWKGYVDISTDNPGHELLKKWLKIKERR